ncbi:hypothetical protein BDZ45DRAFT_684841 [Acephala macrosclerotiorum]|nr:hypothetical protein BDZ45DRAFT_684841 [Acephala macrosclerotiorum]
MFSSLQVQPPETMTSNETVTPEVMASSSSMSPTDSTPSRRPVRASGVAALKAIESVREDEADIDDNKTGIEADLPRRKKRKTSSQAISTKQGKSVTKSLFEPAQLAIGVDKDGNTVVAKMTAQLLLVGTSGPTYVKHGEIKFGEAYDKGSMEATKEYIKGLFKPKCGHESRAEVEGLRERNEREHIIEEQARMIEELRVDNEEKQNAIDGMQATDEENERYIANLEKTIRSLQADLAKSEHSASEAVVPQNATLPNIPSAQGLQANLAEPQQEAGAIAHPNEALPNVPSVQAVQVRPLDLHGECFEDRYKVIKGDDARAQMYMGLNSRIAWQDGNRYRETLMLIETTGQEGTKGIDSIVMARCASCSENGRETLLKQVSPTSYVEHDGRVFAELIMLNEIEDDRPFVADEKKRHE